MFYNVIVFFQADIGEQSKGKTREGANNPVTDGDMKSHLAMFYGLRKTFEGLNIISEEHDSATVDMVKYYFYDALLMPL
jgi:hypothetical protein